MVLKIYGSITSTCTQTIVATFHELDLPYEIIHISVPTGQNKSEEYVLTKQPFGQIPVLIEEDGFQLFESRAIARYLVTKYGAERGLIPPSSDLKALGKFEQAASIEYSNFYPYAMSLAIEKVFKPSQGISGNEARAVENKTILEEKLLVYDVILSKQRFLAGDSFTLADLFHLAYGTLITQRGDFTLLTSGELPHVARWWTEISERKSWKATISERDMAIQAVLKGP